MKESEITIQQTGLKAGLLNATALILYFMLMRWMNWTSSATAWGFNFVILLTGITLTYRFYRSKTQPNIDYLPGMMLGFETTMVTVIAFTLFVFLYFTSVSPALLESLGDNVLFMKKNVSPASAAISTFVEGLCSGIIISFTMMQYYRSGFRRTRMEKSLQG